MKGGSHMNCQEIQELLSAYIDSVLDEQTVKKVEEHLASCTNCQLELADLQFTVDLIRELPKQEAPSHLRESLMTRLAEEKKPIKKKRKFILPTIAVAALLLVAVLVNNPKINMMDDLALSPPMEEAHLRAGLMQDRAVDQMEIAQFNTSAQEIIGEKGQNTRIYSQENSQDNSYQQRIIKNAYLIIAVASHEEAFRTAQDVVTETGGYIQDSSTVSKDGEYSGQLIMRIPHKQLETALEKIEKLGRIETKRLVGTDVTMEYVDVDSRLKVSREKEERLLTLLKGADKLEDILNIERELGYTRIDIEHLEGRIKYLEQATDMATIHLTFSETKTSLEKIALPSGELIWQRAVESFFYTTNRIFHFAGQLIIMGVAVLPLIILVAVLTVGGYLLFKKLKEKNKRDN